MRDRFNGDRLIGNGYFTLHPIQWNKTCYEHFEHKERKEMVKNTA